RDDSGRDDLRRDDLGSPFEIAELALAVAFRVRRRWRALDRKTQDLLAAQHRDPHARTAFTAQNRVNGRVAQRSHVSTINQNHLITRLHSGLGSAEPGGNLPGKQIAAWASPEPDPDRAALRTTRY
ncbi:MAG TPA: hypothetical protein VKP30_11325, partial [Polyangiaceae bacterium]|nr:hypothetical protein [Polyangiaceae bacterium]